MLFNAFILPQASGTLRLFEVIKDYPESADTYEWTNMSTDVAPGVLWVALYPSSEA